MNLLTQNYTKLSLDDPIIKFYILLFLELIMANFFGLIEQSSKAGGVISSFFQKIVSGR